MEDSVNEEVFKKLRNRNRTMETFRYVTQAHFPLYKSPQIDLNKMYNDFPDPAKFKEKVLAMIEDGILLFSVDLKNLKKIADALLDIYDPDTDYDYGFLSECPCGYIDGKADVYLTELGEKLIDMANAEWEYLKKYWEKRNV